MDLDYSDLYSRIKEGEISVNKKLLESNYFFPKEKHYPNSERGISITVEQIKEEGYYVDEITSLAKRIISDIYSVWREAYSYVNREDSFDITADIGL
ncbi:MAG: hypothetical protein MUP81_05350 [Dehalococcoidia bacterium]|nr:hypothetical protein [Dehalococcoidia bacterium]